MRAFTSNMPLRSLSWLGFFAVILLSWLLIFQAVRGSGVDLYGRMSMGAGMEMPGMGFAALFAMWSVMMAAMMFPTLVPTLRAYDDLITSAGATRAGWLAVLGGYFLVWIGIALALSLAQLGLLGAGVVDAMGSARSGWFAGGLLIAVGLYQFSATKERCHGVCHAPAAWFIGHWRPGTLGGLRMGVALGVYCGGCCWGYMALGFTGGVMSLLWMGLATLLMVLEKVPQLGHWIIRPVGAMLVSGGLIVLSGTAGLLN